LVALKRAVVGVVWSSVGRLAAESVERATLTLERVDDVHRGDGLAFGMLSVGDCIADDVLKEDLEHATGLFVDQTRNALDSATTCETANRRLGDALDVIAQHLTMTLGASLSQSLASFAASRHVCL